ncbi:hypothetical protein H4R21_007152, partial [Coemansia helicoidea]
RRRRRRRVPAHRPAAAGHAPGHQAQDGAHGSWLRGRVLYDARGLVPEEAVGPTVHAQAKGEGASHPSRGQDTREGEGRVHGGGRALRGAADVPGQPSVAQPRRPAPVLPCPRPGLAGATRVLYHVPDQPPRLQPPGAPNPGGAQGGDARGDRRSGAEREDLLAAEREDWRGAGAADVPAPQEASLGGIPEEAAVGRAVREDVQEDLRQGRDTGHRQL